MTKLQTHVFSIIFVAFVLVSAALTIALFWPVPKPTDAELSAQRNIVGVLDEISGKTVVMNTDQSGQLLAVVGAPLPAAGEQEIELPLPDGGYRTDFVLNRDAFSFRNYGSSFPEGNLAIDQVREVFGDGVCASIDGDKCVPIPAAQFWIEQMNDAMRQGHCLGFTVLAYDLFTGDLSKENFQGEADATRALTQDTPLMRTIAQRWSLQTTPELLRAAVLGTPRDIIAKLYELREPVDLGLFGRKGGGHSVLAYGADHLGDGLYHILVYDNNWPDQEIFVEVDTKKNTWSYALSGENPGEVPTVWEGDADTRTLIFVPLSAYNQPVTCPFCPPAASASAKPGLAMLQPETPTDNFTTVAIKGNDGLLQITTPEGNRLGHFGDEFVNEIPGALLLRQRGALYNNGEPILYVPSDQDFTLQVLPREGVEEGRTSIFILGPVIVTTFDGLIIHRGQPDQFLVSLTTQDIIYKAGSEQSPNMRFVFVQDGVSYLTAVAGVALDTDDEVALGVDAATGDLTVGSTNGNDQPVSLLVSRVDGNGSSQFASDSFVIPGTAVTDLALPSWQNDTELIATVDDDGDGVEDRTTEVADQPVSALFQTQPLEAETSSQIPTAEMGNLLSGIAPYLPREENQELQEVLLQDLYNGIVDGGQAGAILFLLDELGMDTEEIAIFIRTADLPVEETAALLNNLHLEENEEDEIIEMLELSDTLDVR